MRRTLPLALIPILWTLGAQVHAQTGSPTLKKIAEFDLPGPLGKRFDYLTIDPDDHSLISAHLAAGQRPRVRVPSLPPHDSKLVSVFPSEIWSQTPNGTTEGLPVRSPSDQAQKWKPSSAV